MYLANLVVVVNLQKPPPIKAGRWFHYEATALSFGKEHIMLKNILVIDSDIENFNEIAANLRDDTTDVQYAATVQIALRKMIAFN